MKTTDANNIIGLVPAGGIASRLSPLPCSKELMPVGFGKIGKQKEPHPKVISHYLLENMKLAGVSRIYFILRKGKWDIPEYYGDGSSLNIHIAYLIVDLPFGVPYTIKQAYSFVKNFKIAFGFPDIMFHPVDAFVHLIGKQMSSGADLVLGLFPADRPGKFDMVEQDENGKITQIIIKPESCELPYTWIIALWTPVFTEYLNHYLKSEMGYARSNTDFGTGAIRPEYQISDVILNAVRDQLKVETVTFPEGRFIDIGTPEDLIRAADGL